MPPLEEEELELEEEELELEELLDDELELELELEELPPPQVKVAEPPFVQWVYQLLLGTATLAVPLPLLQFSEATTM